MLAAEHFRGAGTPRPGGLPPAWCRFGPTTYRRRSMPPVPPLLRPMSSDEFDPVPWGGADRAALARVAEVIGRAARRAGTTEPAYATDRRGTAATLRAIDQAHGGGYFARARGRAHSSWMPPTPRSQEPLRSSTCRPTWSTRPVGSGPGAAALDGVPANGRPRPLVGRGRPACDRRRRRGRRSCSAPRRPRSRCSHPRPVRRARTCSPTRRSPPPAR